MKPKYILSNETRVIDGVTLYRIRAKRSFENVKTGEMGGWIESESNLSHGGSCWVGDDAIVMNTAQVYGNALVLENATVDENAHVYGNACICGDSYISGNAQIFDEAYIYDNAEIDGNAKVYNNAKVGGRATIKGNVKVYDNVHISVNAEVSEDAIIHGNTALYGKLCIHGNADISMDIGNISCLIEIADDAYIRSVKDYNVIERISGIEKRANFYKTKDGDINVLIRELFKGSLKEFEEMISERFKDKVILNDLLMMIKFIENTMRV